jgi:hypothetical protein
MLIQTNGLAFPATSNLGISNQAGAPGGVAGELLISQLLPRYSALVKSGKVFQAYATNTAPGIWSTAAGIGGPLLWNRPASNVDAHILAVGIGVSVVSTVAGSIGLTGNSGQSVAPTTTTAIDGSGNMLVGGASSSVTAYRIGTPANAGSFFQPLAHVHTGALTVDNFGIAWIPVDGMLVLPPGAWCSLAGSAVLTTLQAGMSIVWCELPA